MKSLQIGRIEIFRTSSRFVSEYHSGMRYTTLDGRNVRVLFTLHSLRLVCIWKTS